MCNSSASYIVNSSGLKYVKVDVSPTCSLPLKTYSLQPSNGFLASGGSLYFKTVVVPSEAFTVLVAAASRPDAAKLGFPLSTGEVGRDPDTERDRLRGRPERGYEFLEGGEADRRLASMRSLRLSASLYRVRSWSRSPRSISRS